MTSLISGEDPVHKPVSLITGSGKGIGAAIAKLLASKGHNVVIHFSKSNQEADATASACEQLGAEVLLHQADISTTEGCVSLVESTLKKWGKIDHLVNNAGTTISGDFSDLSLLDKSIFEKIFNLNFYGALTMSQLAAPHLAANNNSSIVNISSAAGSTGIGSSVAYCCSKGALNTLTLSLAKALAPKIRVNAVSPGIVESTWWNARITDPEKLKNFYQKQTENSPLNILMSPEDVAKTVLFLIESPFITGEIIRINAGNHVGPYVAPKK